MFQSSLLRIQNLIMIVRVNTTIDLVTQYRDEPNLKYGFFDSRRVQCETDFLKAQGVTRVAALEKLNHCCIEISTGRFSSKKKFCII